MTVRWFFLRPRLRRWWPRGGFKTGRGSQQFPELLDAHARVAHNRAHGVGVHRVVTRHNDMNQPFGHENVLALAVNAEARLFQRLHGAKVFDARKLRSEEHTSELQSP